MKTIIFTDGSSRGNPGPGGWGAIVAYSEENPSTSLRVKKIRELGGGEKSTTNNRMEMMAVISALEFVKKNIESFDESEITLFTDSEYVKKGATEWIFAWSSNNWRTKANAQVLNRDLWEEMLRVMEDLDIDWKVIPGHSGIPGNERCDEIATSFADEKPTKLFYGSADHYHVSLEAKSEREVKKSGFSTNTSKPKKAYSYVSAVKGVVKIHKTWADCEARVKGQAHARYRKAMNKDEEMKLINEFGR